MSNVFKATPVVAVDKILSFESGHRREICETDKNITAAQNATMRSGDSLCRIDYDSEDSSNPLGECRGFAKLS
jgi:hypothetical protein